MRWLLHGMLGVGVVTLFTACEAEAPPPTEVALTVAPLDLPGVTDAVYDLEVLNGADQIVFQRRISSTAYGNGDGSASYVGPCDADSNDNTVALTLVELYADGVLVSASDYKNPGRLERDFTCLANQDVAVSFDITLIRPANQGFFDIAVTFDNIFCSAKLDCKGSDGQPIKLLHTPTGGRGTTLVLGFACTTGNTADITTLYRDNITLTCGAQTVTVNPQGEGNLPAGNITGTSSLLFGAQSTRGLENFAFDKQYWNVMLGFVDGTPNCVLSTSASAARGYFEFKTTPVGTSYPYIVWDAIQVSNGSGALVCNQHPVDGVAPKDGVETVYAPLGSGESFDHLWSTHGIPIQGAGTFAAPRRWADDTVAARCLDYFTPTAPYTYTGATGDAFYRIDPDGAGGNAPFVTRCDMTNGGWTRVAFEDFEDQSQDAPGWSWAIRPSTCGTFGSVMWNWYSGSPAPHNGWTRKLYSWAAIAHADVRVNADYFMIDGWEGYGGTYDAGYVDIGKDSQTGAVPSGSQSVQIIAANSPGPDWSPQCGSGGWEARQSVAVTYLGQGTWSAPDSPNAVWVRASSVLNEGGPNESFGIDNVAIWVK